MLENVDFDGEQRDEEIVSSFLSGFKTIKDFEVFRLGNYKYHGKGKFDGARIDRIVSNTNELIEKGEHEPPCKTSHAADNLGQPVAGRWSNFRRKGDMIIGDLRTTAKGFYDWVKNGGFRERSIELWTKNNPYHGPSGKKTDIIKAVAFVPNPEVKGMLPAFADFEFQFSDQKAEQLIFTEGDDMGEEDKKPGAEGEGTDDKKTGAEGGDKKPEDKKTGGAEGGDDGKKADEGTDGKSGGEGDKGSEGGDAGSGEGKGNEGGDGGSGGGEGGGDMSDGKKKTVKVEGDFKYPTGKDGKKKSDARLQTMKINVNNFGDEATIKETIGGMTDEERIERLEKVEAEAVKTKIADSDRFLDDMVKDGKIIPAQKDFARVLMHPANDNVSYDFGEKDGKPQVMTAREAFKKFVEAGKKQVSFGESAKQNGAGAGEDAPDAKTDGEPDEKRTKELVDSYFEDEDSKGDDDKK